jgi:hypothetical protein
MTLLIPLAVLAVVGWIVAFPIVAKGTADLARIPGAVWRITGYRSRKQWRLAMRGGFLLGGWPGLLAVVVWRRSETREVLRDEWHLLIEERRARRELNLSRLEDEEADDREREGNGPTR